MKEEEFKNLMEKYVETLVISSNKFRDELILNDDSISSGTFVALSNGAAAGLVLHCMKNSIFLLKNKTGHKKLIEQIQSTLNDSIESFKSHVLKGEICQ